MLSHLQAHDLSRALQHKTTSLPGLSSPETQQPHLPFASKRAISLTLYNAPVRSNSLERRHTSSQATPMVARPWIPRNGKPAGALWKEGKEGLRAGRPSAPGVANVLLQALGDDRPSGCGLHTLCLLRHCGTEPRQSSVVYRASLSTPCAASQKQKRDVETWSLSVDMTDEHPFAVASERDGEAGRQTAIGAGRWTFSTLGPRRAAGFEGLPLVEEHERLQPCHRRRVTGASCQRVA